jgi:hypothetical protein
MGVPFSNFAFVVILLSAFVVGVKGQDTQSPSSSQPARAAQFQNEPAGPSQNAPQQESPKDQPQTQPPAQAPNAAPPQSGPAQPNEATPDRGLSKEQGTEQKAPPTEAPPDQTSQPKPHPTAKSKSTKKKRTTSSKTQSTDSSGKVVVRNGGLRESTTQISPGGNDQQAQSQRTVTSQLLATTDANLKKVSGQQLTPAQQSMLDQVNAYVRQSKAASDEGDIPRAHTLAVKAQLLSNELARK